jgi:hypothetical protein
VAILFQLNSCKEPSNKDLIGKKILIRIWVHRAQLVPKTDAAKTLGASARLATMAAALRILLRQHAAAPPSPMLRSLFPAPYSKVRWKQFRCLILLKPSPRLGALTSIPFQAAVAAAAAGLPAARGASLSPPRLREVTPRKAPPTPKV